VGQLNDFLYSYLVIGTIRLSRPARSSDLFRLVVGARWALLEAPPHGALYEHSF
jgi:hypothetical protein